VESWALRERLYEATIPVGLTVAVGCLLFDSSLAFHYGTVPVGLLAFGFPCLLVVTMIPIP